MQNTVFELICTHTEVAEKWIASIIERGFHGKTVCLTFVFLIFLRVFRRLIFKQIVSNSKHQTDVSSCLNTTVCLKETD